MARNSPARRTSPRKRPGSSSTNPKRQALGPARSPLSKKQGSEHSQHETVAPKVRKAPHCTQCPGKPLRSQCCHTKVGREYLLTLNLQQRASNFPIAGSEAQTTTSTVLVAPNIHCSVSAPRPIVPDSERAPIATPATSPAPVPTLNTTTQHSSNKADERQQFQHLSRAGAANYPVLAHPNQVERLYQQPQYVLNNVFQVGGGPLSTPATYTPFGPPSALADFRAPTPTSPTPHRTNPAASPCLTERNPSPALTTPNNADSYGAASRSSPPPGSPAHHLLETSPASLRSASALVTDSGSSQRTKPSAANPIHGCVHGVLRGSSNPYTIVRSHTLPQPILESKVASKRFRDGVNSIVRRCEELAAQTSCWIFVGAQHAAATGGAIHYASPRIRRDGGSETDALATQFIRLIKMIQESKRVDTIELQRTLAESQDKTLALETRVHLLESQAQEETEKHQKDMEMIQEYRRLLGLNDS